MSAPSSSSAARVFVVTGSNTGVGFETARQIALGAADAREKRHIILACRTPSKAAEAVKRIQAELADDSLVQVEAMQLDVTDYNSITHFVDEYTRRGLKLHCLVNNAGVNAPPASLGQPLKCEHMFVSNYLGGFLLTQLLLPLLEASAPSRVVNVTSFMHRIGSTDFEGMMRGCKTDHRSYSSSKLAQIYQAHEIQRRYAQKGVSALLAHPGACSSDIWRGDGYALLRPIFKAAFLTTEQGAKPIVHAATKLVGDGRSADARGASKEVEHFGPYPQPLAILGGALDAWQPSCFTRVTQSKTSKLSYEREPAERLWKLSESLCQEWKAAAEAQ